MRANAITGADLRTALGGTEPPIVIDARRQVPFLASSEMIGGALILYLSIYLVKQLRSQPAALRFTLALLPLVFMLAQIAPKNDKPLSRPESPNEPSNAHLTRG